MKYFKLLLILISIFALSNLTSYTESISFSKQSDKPIKKVLNKFGESEILTVVPPINFDPLKATDEELSYYGLPARPADPEQYKNWVENVGNKKYVEPSLKVVPINEVFGNGSLLNQKYDANDYK